MAEINWTNEAEKWLKDIYNFIAIDNSEAAIKVVQGIFNKVQLLSKYPDLGYKYAKIPGKNIRILLYGHYRIAYLIKSSNQIDILGVFHGALDINQYLY